MEIPVFGKEQYPLNRESGLSYTISDIYKHVPIHTHNHYELFIISEGTAYHMINDSVQTVRKGDLFFIRPNDMHSYNFYHSENFCVRNLGFSTQVLRNVSLFLEQEEKMDKLINSEMPAYVHLEGENFRKVLDAMDTAGKLVNSSHPRHARYHAQCVIALLLEDYFFTYDEKDPWNQMPSWLSELLLNMSKIENLQEGYEKMCELAPCSPSHLCRLLKQICGKTPTQYINQERLKYAVYLLAQTDREILDICEVKPVVLQTEVHPYYQEKKLKDYLKKEGIVIQAWYPLGHGDKALLEEPLFQELGKKYGKSSAQIILHWHIQAGNIVIPGSKSPAHIQDNFDLFDFSLTAWEMAQISIMDKNVRYYTSTPELLQRYAAMVPPVDEQK